MPGSEAYSTSWEKPLQSSETPQHYSNMSLQAFPELSASRARDAWHDLDNELTQNVKREFPACRTQAEAHFKDFLLPMGRGTPLPDDFFDSDHKPTDRGYMEKSSPFSLDCSQPNLSVMARQPSQEAVVITYLSEFGEVIMMPKVESSHFEARCPLLVQAFEYSRSGTKLHLEMLTPATAPPFIRYIKTGSYACPSSEGDIYGDVPTSILLHCQLFHLGGVYDLPDLKQQAYVNVARQCEFGCSSPDKPIELCKAIQYMYKHLHEHANLIETIICYCVSCFTKHRLDADFEFRTMAFDFRLFQQDLVRECMKRNFEDDTASAIVNLPFKPYIPSETYASREDVTPNRCTDVIHHFHASDEHDSSFKKRKREEKVFQGPDSSALILALRQKSNETSGAMGLAQPALSVGELGIGSSKKRLSIGLQETVGSDSEFAIIAGPASVEELSSDSDREEDTAVVVDDAVNVPHITERALPIRGGSGSRSFTMVDIPAILHDDSGSESDWTVV